MTERRRALGLSQAKLAKMVGVTQPTIGKLEAGISLGSSYIHKIARALGTTAGILNRRDRRPERRSVTSAG
ncbi:helix-turn-helix transcriptional regulator [Sphingomonas aerolata]|uniref:helix-turn-helix transcriptional regulator n=1 Tax=Sphingomonas aerolata TaxID=185951 RepID=UPI003A5B99A9